MNAARYRASGQCGPFKASPGDANPPIVPVTHTYAPWAAVVDDNQYYYGAQGTWIVPSPYKNDGQTRFASQWVGVGGNCGSGCGGELVQAGTDVET